MTRYDQMTASKHEAAVSYTADTKLAKNTFKLAVHNRSPFFHSGIHMPYSLTH